MKFSQVVSVSSAVLGLMGCARSQEASAPAASAAPASAGSSSFASAPPVASEPSPAPAPPSRAERDTSRDRLTKPKASEEEFSNLQAALDALNQAQADLDRIALEGPVLGQNKAADARAENKASKGSPPRAEAPASAGGNQSGSCANACRAFSSLTRAADAVCRLDGTSGAHCARAKRLVEDSQRRVASCSCSASTE